MSDSNSSAVSKIALEAYSGAASHLVNSAWMKETIDLNLEEIKSTADLCNLLEKEMNKQEDKTRQTDIKIYLTYLEQLRQKF
ncbi:MAG: hypothetical protein ABIH76_09375 [Candidatus Bathyarchaeota archaeon]